MTPELVAELCRDTFLTAFLVAGPALGVGLVVGVAVSLLMAITQINEMTLSFIPKIAAIAGALLLATPWMLHKLADFAQRMMERLPGIVG